MLIGLICFRNMLPAKSKAMTEVVQRLIRSTDNYPFFVIHVKTNETERHNYSITDCENHRRKLKILPNQISTRDSAEAEREKEYSPSHKQLAGGKVHERFIK